MRAQALLNIGLKEEAHQEPLVDIQFHPHVEEFRNELSRGMM